MRAVPALACLIAAVFLSTARAQVDPGVQNANRGTGAPLPGLTAGELAIFADGKVDFEEAEEVDEGLGPVFNFLSCVGCHSQPNTGGTSPSSNPQATLPNVVDGSNALPPFIAEDGPVHEARFKLKPDGTRDGGVHALFTVKGLEGAEGCNATQPDFAAQVAAGNVSLRIPTPVFGGGLIEAIPDAEILRSFNATASARTALGIAGHPNRNANDGTITRFGWKAQNASLLLFSAEAYNVEMGITNELFPSERDESAGCTLAPRANSITNLNEAPTNSPERVLSSIEKFAFFMRFLAPPPVASPPVGGMASFTNGAAKFAEVGCALCHTPVLQTGPSSVAALSNKPVKLFSDLMLHAMGPELRDDIVQGEAGPNEFRTAPLWGLGQRVFLLHDGRTTNLLDAIDAHRGEAGPSRQLFRALSPAFQQDILNFLRSL